jgi:hypothetical protein
MEIRQKTICETPAYTRWAVCVCKLVTSCCTQKGRLYRAVCKALEVVRTDYGPIIRLVAQTWLALDPLSKSM